MTSEDIKSEIKSYVEVLETHYNDKIKEMKVQIDRMERKAKKERGMRASERMERTELEELFVGCIEDVRKEVVKRRVKSEVEGKKKGKKREGDQGVDGVEREEEEAKEFEESLMKVAAYAKGRIKYEDFTSKDKFNILDLFVNNEKTLIKIYEALFPHRVLNKSAL